ncbi:hypothetical protein EVA_13473 [gut metagenome]|uniref:Uncharacterized protein n=1 Tax=gut metagenome TaxID=749906 RepID=J9FV82_9ZZZZ
MDKLRNSLTITSINKLDAALGHALSLGSSSKNGRYCLVGFHSFAAAL